MELSNSVAPSGAGLAWILRTAQSYSDTNAKLAYSGLARGLVGLYEFYITAPSGLANGDYQINVMQKGTNAAQTMYLTVQN
jgi:uncharacterized protein (TIGR03437 family)